MANTHYVYISCHIMKQFVLSRGCLPATLAEHIIVIGCVGMNVGRRAIFYVSSTSVIPIPNGHILSHRILSVQIQFHVNVSCQTLFVRPCCCGCCCSCQCACLHNPQLSPSRPFASLDRRRRDPIPCACPWFFIK